MQRCPIGEITLHWFPTSQESFLPCCLNGLVGGAPQIHKGNDDFVSMLGHTLGRRVWDMLRTGVIFLLFKATDQSTAESS